MSERLLDAFREEAERTTPVPDFELIEAAGRRRRQRRRSAVAAVVACAVAVAGLLAVTQRSPADDTGPAGDPRSAATPYPGPQMVTLAEGTYDLTPYADVALPAARVTIPDGWNASAYGPDRFAGVGPTGADNAGATDDSPWYAGLVVTEVDFLRGDSCATVELVGAGTDEVLAALRALPRQEVTSGPDATTRFGRPAFHLTLRESRPGPDCQYGSLFNAAEGRIGRLGLGGTYDVWLVEVEDDPLLVVAGWTRDAPSTAVEELLAMVDSIELHPRDLPWRE